MNYLTRIARKEFAGFFSSPVAFIFLGGFLAVSLFVFFWVETFFARNIADIRPLFEWMPILLIFLCAAITMRMWSEERRAGTLEFLLTSPVAPLQLVLGKFFACLALVAVALALTLPLPFSVAMIGPLDWGPVFGGYLATLFLAAFYIALGLFVSARSENQIVSLLIASLLGALFYALGANMLTGLFGTKTSEILKLLGSGARFESIGRGIIDLRDLYYYLSLTGVFLTLNIFVLERQRWAGNPSNSHHRSWGIVAMLFVCNFLAGNFWMAPISWARADITTGRIYSISDATRGYLSQLKEPLLIRGYFSAKTHPLLAPLVPRLRDLLEEYAIAGKGHVRVEFVDPVEKPEVEQEAGQKYGIKPVPFQFASKYQSAVVNSYFDIVIQYGDQYETLGFRELIEVKVQSESDLKVDLRNPEYDITRTIKKVLYTYQGAGELFDNISHPVVFKEYFSPDEKLPPQLVNLKSELGAIMKELEKSAKGKLKVEVADPEASGGALAKQLESRLGLRPMSLGIFSTEKFWFYMALEGGGNVVQVPLPEDLGKAGLDKAVQAALKRFSKGLLKTIALHVPEPAPEQAMEGMPAGANRFAWLHEALSQEHTVRMEDLKKGRVLDEADLLVLLSPEKLDQKQLFALDQFLMRGGTVIVSTSAFNVSLGEKILAKKHDSGLGGWLKHNGIVVEDKLVLDPKNAAFPIPVQRNLGGFIVQETRMVEYPYFVDIRRAGINRESGIAAGVEQVTLNWASPLTINPQANKGRKVTRLLESSPDAWASDSLTMEPDFQAYGQLGFPAGKKKGRQLLAVAVEGTFDSYFKGKPSPLVTTKDDARPVKPEDVSASAQDKKEAAIDRVIERSAESSKIILFSSNSFLSDSILELASSGMGTQYLNPVQLVENAVDWSLEDRGLLGIRGRAGFSRTLAPIGQGAQMLWENINYGLALLGLVSIWVIRRIAMTRARARHQMILDAKGA